ncbi:MAG: D-glutamate deacylase [Chitinophagia bacterium]|jgi:dihydroorotase|nr:D-glutamate deacylase [Chitinophagia bacterium]NCA29578.1 D-glutamate deacylase [Chitinophagia bacterium]
MKKYHFKILIVWFSLCLCQLAKAQSKPVFDIVLVGGRVIDPETKLDAIRNIGILNGRIASISTNKLIGKELIDVKGLVVAPGFIDMHVHGRTNQEQEFQLHDGLTTALELEWGVENIEQWYDSRKSKALINFGASVCWPFERFRSMEKYKDANEKLLENTINGNSSLEGLFNAIGVSYKDKLSKEESNKMLMNINKSLAEGGIGIGIPIGYLPKTNPEELYAVYKYAGEKQVLLFSHLREPNMLSFQEAIANATLTQAPLHIVHINSMALGHIQMALEMIEAAKKRGVNISTEMYPYTAGSTLIQSAIFNEGWQERLDMSYNNLQWVLTGERLTKETFDKFRQTGGTVIIHNMQPEWLKLGMENAAVMIASDGMPYSALAHPRTAGTFSRVLGKYVREDKVLDLNTAIAKITLLPAKRLESIAPSMHQKGRIQVGADADITIFNADKIIDKASFEKGLAFSEGVEFVIVNGTLVLKNGKTVTGVFPGKAIVGKFKK